MAGICLNPLTTRDGPVLAVHQFTGTLQPGRITGVRGPNGAGTTTTLRIPVELTRPTPGTPIIAGSTPARRARRPSNPGCAGPTLLPAGPGVVSS